MIGLQSWRPARARACVLVLAVAALSAMVGAGCGGTGGAAVDDAQAAAERFLDELRAGRVAPAWEGASSEFKSLMGVESLRDYVKAHPALKADARFEEARPVGGGASTECVFHATAPATARTRGKPAQAASPATIRVLLARGDGGWKVERLAVD